MSKQSFYVVNLNRVQQSSRDEYFVVDINREEDCGGYSPSVHSSLEEAEEAAWYGAWYVEMPDGELNGPHMSKVRAVAASKQLEAKAQQPATVTP